MNSTAPPKGSGLVRLLTALDQAMTEPDQRAAVEIAATRLIDEAEYDGDLPLLRACRAHMGHWLARRGFSALAPALKERVNAALVAVSGKEFN